MKHIVLIGMMGSGKSTVGRLLGRLLGREVVDTDQLIEQREGRSIPAIMAAEGEEAFRRLEEQLGGELARRQGLIVSCGGGLPLREKAILPLRESGRVFWLDRDPGESYDGLELAHRPLAQQGRADFVARYQARRPIYERESHHRICQPSPRQAAEAILSILAQEEGEP